MKIYDISQELFTCSVFPGDETPVRNMVETIEGGSIYNLTNLSMCAHNGTHVDAPYHFYQNGKTIDQMKLESVIGKCYVGFADGPVTEAVAQKLVEKARSFDLEASKYSDWRRCFCNLRGCQSIYQRKGTLNWKRISDRRTFRGTGSSTL